MAAKPTNNSYSAKFWDPSARNFCLPKKVRFPLLGDLPPFVFANHDTIQNCFLFFTVCKCVLKSTDKIMMKLFMTSKLLQMITTVMPFFLQKTPLKNFTAKFSHFLGAKKVFFVTKK